MRRRRPSIACGVVSQLVKRFLVHSNEKPFFAFFLSSIMPLISFITNYTISTKRGKYFKHLMHNVFVDDMYR